MNAPLILFRLELCQNLWKTFSIKHSSLNEPHYEKTNNLHMRKQRRRSATAMLISAFVFATRIVQLLYFLNPKFPASSHLLCLYRPVCGGPVRKPHCWFSQEAAQISMYLQQFLYKLTLIYQFPLFVSGHTLYHQSYK